MKLRAARTLARLALCLAVAVGLVACKKDGGGASTPAGAWLSDDGLLLLRVFADDRVVWYFAAGGGSCVYLAEGSIDETKGVLVSEFEDEYPYQLDGDVLELADPRGDIDGTYARIVYDDVCFVHVPALGAESARVTTLALGQDVSVQGGVGHAVELAVPADAVSLGFYLFGDTVGSTAAFGALIAPNGTNVLDERNLGATLAEDDLQFCTAGFCSLVVPKQATIVPAAGTWRAVVVANAESDLEGVSVRGIVRAGPLPAQTTFTVRPFLTTSLVPSAQIAAALSEVATLFDATYGVTLTIEPITELTGPTLVVQDFLQPDTAALMAMGDPDSLNLFFAERLLGMGGLLGIASGIPASHGVAGPFDGLLVHLENHLDGDGSLVPSWLVETIAHEIGHMLGLYHPTESEADFFDPIADTPECTLADNDLDMDGTVYADECADAGGDNLMFWTPSTTTGASLTQQTLTADQLFVLERSLGGQ